MSPSTFVDGSVEARPRTPRPPASSRSPSTFVDGSIEARRRRRRWAKSCLDERGSYESQLDDDRSTLIKHLTGGYQAMVAISHAGRLRLWALRDELLRNPDEEPMGLLSKLAWERALPLGLQFAGDDAPLSVLLLDLDDFGKVNKEQDY